VPELDASPGEYQLALPWLVKRDLVQCQKRPSTVSKETQYSVKRDLLQKHILNTSGF
jgi:hypothetical protein